MTNRVGFNARTLILAGSLFLGISAGLARPAASEARAKYYFTVTNVVSEDRSIIPLAKELLAKDVASRPEFTSDLGGIEGKEAQSAELKKRGLTAYEINLRVASFKREERSPAPGRRDPQLAIDVKLSVYGTTYPGNKVAFTGDGEASLVGEFSERRRDKDIADLTSTALSSALKQAVSTGVTKMTTPSLGGPVKGKKAKRVKNAQQGR